MPAEYISIRLSHLLKDCSVGAVVRGSDNLVVVPDIRYWDRPGSSVTIREIKYVERIKSALNIKKRLRTPPSAIETDGQVLHWIPALTFPTWTRCMKCGLLHHAPWRQRATTDRAHNNLDPNENFTEEECKKCGGKLEQVPWILVHEEGYLADVDWHFLAHDESKNPKHQECARSREEYLELRYQNADLRLSCKKCNVSREFKSGKLPPVPFSPFTWQQPWMQERPAKSPTQPALLVQVNDVRVHSPDTRTALVIPPESRIRKGSVTDRLYSQSRDLKKLIDAKNFIDQKRRIKEYAREFKCSKDEIREAIFDIQKGYPLYGKTVSSYGLLVDEYQALTQEIPDISEKEDFVTKHYSREWKRLCNEVSLHGNAKKIINVVSKVVAVNKLKEVMVLRGFSRANGQKLTPPDLTGECDWLPAIELYGEGIFFTLDEAILGAWEACDALEIRTESFKERYMQREGHNSLESTQEITSRFLLCHTLAHLIMRRLDAHAGYPTASLKERIYCSATAPKMAGILIYVAVSDEEGSLGGLMELAKPDRFLPLLVGAFEDARWCSLDPVCSEMEGHGLDLLNRAACHACALVAETSCEFGNVLLDRTYVRGASPDIPSILDIETDVG